ncbi:hypothetical protein COV93_05110, partial [Candidatus Woesearchaeota archaeon CG11_big_fil_rev_8_21_14_0_20_43_8]
KPIVKKQKKPSPRLISKDTIGDNLQVDSKKSYPIVGIGASAGGLEALIEFLKQLPAKNGMAFVIVQHLDPNHPSILPELLSRVTKMDVKHAQNNMKIEKDNVYVIPPNTYITIKNRILKLSSNVKSQGPRMSIDYFFKSLATDLGNNAIGIILSGSGSDGTFGLADIKEHGGVAFVQDAKTAKFNGMPHSAIANGSIDFVLPPKEIADELIRITKHDYIHSKANSNTVEENLQLTTNRGLGQLLRLLYDARGVDFSGYKQTTILRRIKRRMLLCKADTYENYAAYCTKNPDEIIALYHDLLIKVSTFFRDPDSFDALKTKVFPNMIKNLSGAKKSLRIWVGGCANGEEAYSIIISLLEYLEDKASRFQINLFATDIDEEALINARNGIYLENIAADVSPERLRRFFSIVDNRYQINKSVRDLCTFARHDLCSDPPFSNLDLISCRNVLIYLENHVQKKVIPIFHYALKQNGHLMLGGSETIGTFTDIFNIIDKKNRIYTRQATISPHPVDFFSVKKYQIKVGREKMQQHIDRPIEFMPRKEFDVFKEADRAILNKYNPVGVLINDKMDILQFRGDTSHYLIPSPGKASLNLMKMLRDGLGPSLRNAMNEARKGRSVHRNNVKVHYERKIIDVDIQVIPLNLPSAQCFIVLFERSDLNVPKNKREHSKTTKSVKKNQKLHEVSRLLEELEDAKRELQTTIEDSDATSEELKSANEEILSSNEELQSMNEELETAKEELQSTNEELITVNEGIENNNLELSKMNSDFNNIFNSIDIALVMLDSDLRIRRFSQKAENILHLIPTDIGRSITDIRPSIQIPNQESEIIEVMDSVKAKSWEIQNKEGIWYQIQIKPYIDEKRKIDGVVLSYLNIHSIKDVNRLTQLLNEAKTAKDYAEAIVKIVPEPLIVIDKRMVVNTANQAFYDTFNLTADLTLGKVLFQLSNNQWDLKSLRGLLENISLDRPHISNHFIEHDFLDIGHMTLLLSAHMITQIGDQHPLILLAIKDITESKRSEEKINRSLIIKETLLKEVHHRVKNNLQIISSLLRLQSKQAKDERLKDVLTESQNRITAIALIHETLYSSENIEIVDLENYIIKIGKSLLRSYDISQNKILIDTYVKNVYLDMNICVTCGLILSELITNSIKYAFPENKSGVIKISLTKDKNTIQLIYQDNGVGLSEEHQEGYSSLGMKLVKTLVEQIDGTLEIVSKKGMHTIIVFPLPKD